MTYHHVFATILFLLAFIMTEAAQAGDVTVKINMVESAEGSVRVSICSADEFLMDNCMYESSEKAMMGEVFVKFRNVAPGTYGIQAFHDIDNSGVFQKKLFVLPAESYGFSNNPRIVSSAPTFMETMVTVGMEPVTFTIDFNSHY